MIPFSEFEGYLREKSREADYCTGAILDTNILVSLTYDVKSNYEEITEFFSTIEPHGIPYFTTVTTRSEFLDFHRRLILTENLISATSPESSWKLSKASRAAIKTQQGLLNSRIAKKPGSDPVFSDSDIKAIKKAFSAGRFSGHDGWLALCAGLLGGRLERTETLLTTHSVTYISQHDKSQQELFHTRIEWPEARTISELTGLGLSDSMILNALRCSRFAYAMSADFDVGYAVLADKAGTKDVVMPDSMAAEFRGYHF